MAKRRFKPGDIIEVVLPKGFAYIRFAGRLEVQEFPMDVFEVLDNEQLQRVKGLENLRQLTVKYTISGLVKEVQLNSDYSVVGTAPLDEIALPKVWRKPWVGGWQIIENDTANFVSELDEASETLPIAQLISSKQIRERIISSWHPRLDRMNMMEALRNASSSTQRANSLEPRGSSKETLKQWTLCFFVEFDSGKDISSAVNALRSKGFLVARDGDQRLSVTIKVSELLRNETSNWISKLEHDILEMVGSKIRTLCRK
jgi:hypothetical protein